MDITVCYMAFSIAFAAFIVLAYAWKLLNWVWFKPKKLEKLLRQQGFSGNSYKLFHGDTKEISRFTKEAKSKPISFSDDIVPRILPFNLHIISNYGNKSFIWIGPTPIIHITNPRLIREILLNNDAFQKPNDNPLTKLLVTGMVSYEGQRWSTVRKIANPAFHQDKLKDMLPKIYKSCDDMITNWKILVSNKESFELDVWPHIQTLTADVISRTAFGSSYKEGRKIFELITEQIQLFIEAKKFVYVPGWRFLPTTRNRQMNGNYNEIRKLIKGIIHKREEAVRVGRACSNDDLLGVLMESNHKRIQEKEIGMSLEEVIEECKLFYLAGQETTGSLLVWTLVLLCLNPHWQERAREEVFKVFGDKEPKFDELSKLKEVSKIIYEVLRLYSPAAVFNRVSVKETKLGEFIVPAGTLISVPILLVHHDREYWGDDAKDFNPDRFSQGVSKASKTEFSFFPFGGGPRICIGQNFAVLEVKLALSMILHNFSFQLSPTYIHAPTSGLILYPQHGAHMILRKI